MAPKRRNPYDRFLNHTKEQADGCIVWTAYKGENGYGRFWVDDRGALAHRWSYQFHVGPIADGLVIDHLCRNKACVNPEHLEPVTPSQNVLRGVGPQIAIDRGLARTHCKRGHELTEENTYVRGNSRDCLTCKREHRKAEYAANRQLFKDRARDWRLANLESAREISQDGQRRRRAKQKTEAA